MASATASLTISGSSTATVSTTPLEYFHLFPTLVIELRLNIWDTAANEPRLIIPNLTRIHETPPYSMSITMNIGAPIGPGQFEACKVWAKLKVMCPDLEELVVVIPGDGRQLNVLSDLVDLPSGFGTPQQQVVMARIVADPGSVQDARNSTRLNLTFQTLRLTGHATDNGAFTTSTRVKIAVMDPSLTAAIRFPLKPRAVVFLKMKGSRKHEEVTLTPQGLFTSSKSVSRCPNEVTATMEAKNETSLPFWEVIWLSNLGTRHHTQSGR
ncbi:hypothetical protein BDZ45DRAFT_747244 [Acephala macrosclerotiorum]|nr:hypothetical protein BDZ45DRAFT_747244 [Acephala macrosclerotiorum]